MEKVLMILEVSRKQDYIFKAKALRENSARSACISYVTSSKFFEACSLEYTKANAVPPLYSEKENLVYSGGGHTIVQFFGETAEEARAKASLFARTVSEAAIRNYDGLELFAKQIPFDAASSPKNHFLALTIALEAKKALRLDAIRQISFGIEKPSEPRNFSGNQELAGTLPAPPAGYTYPTKFEDLAGEDPFIAVVHIDGNGMGGRVNGIYEKEGAANWDTCCDLLKEFSTSIQSGYENAFRRLCQKLIPYAVNGNLPIRPVVLAGDDVCFVTVGSLGLSCADYLLKELSQTYNSVDRLPYTACAGVALVHKKYPFYQAYRLSEELCGNAKKFSASMDAEKRVSAIDWHIEFGQLKSSLDDIREDYKTTDGDWMLLRPVASVTPAGCKEEIARTFAYFREMTQLLQRNTDGLAVSKLKNLRSAIKQGETEANYYLHDQRIGDLLYNSFSAEHPNDTVRSALEFLCVSSANGKKRLPRETFRQIGETKRCLYFDAIELMDHCQFF